MSKPTVRRIDAQNCVHLPAEVMAALSVGKGDYVSLAVGDGMVEVRKVWLP